MVDTLAFFNTLLEMLDYNTKESNKDPFLCSQRKQRELIYKRISLEEDKSHPVNKKRAGKNKMKERKEKSKTTEEGKSFVLSLFLSLSLTYQKPQ